jgi:Family of unknown function (DUF6208)
MSNFTISYLWEIPLALFSFVFYKIAKFIIGNLYTIYLAINCKIGSRWQVLSQELIDSPLSLPVLMTKAPRWNTHATIGTLGPFLVGEYLELDLVAAGNSADSWIAIFYSFPQYQTIATIESEKIKTDDTWYKINLKSGKYTIGLRYYNTKNELVLPAIKIDDLECTEATKILPNINSFYEKLARYSSWFYLAMHYYIFTILRLRQYLPESFVKYEYLPVGATDTFFAYDYLDRRKKLQIQFPPEFLVEYELYLTFYNRSSFPVAWFKLDKLNTSEDIFIYKKHQENLSYLIRIRHKKLAATDFLDRLSATYNYDEGCQYLNICQIDRRSALS